MSGGTGVTFDDGTEAVQSRYWKAGTGLSIVYDANGRPQLNVSGGTPDPHVIADTTGLGTYHTTSGLTAGQVLRATGATTAAFQSLVAGDLPAHNHAGSDINSGVVGVTYGGTGQDFSAAAQGSVIVINSIGVLSIAPGVSDGDILTYTLGTDSVGWAAPAAGGPGTGTISYVPYWNTTTTLADSPLRRDATDEMFFEDVDVVTIDSVDATNVHLKLYSYLNGPGGSNFIDGFAASVKDAPTGISYNNQVMLGLSGFGHTGTGYGEGGRIQIRAAANWSATVFTTDIGFFTREGNGTLTERWTIEPGGDLLPFQDSVVAIGSNLLRPTVVYADSFDGPGGGITGIDASNITSGVLGVTYGGTGQDWSAAAQGGIIWTDGVGSFAIANGVTDGDVLTYTLGTDSVGWATPSGGPGTGTATYIPYWNTTTTLADSPLIRASSVYVRLDGEAFYVQPTTSLARADIRAYGYGSAGSHVPVFQFLYAEGNRTTPTVIGGTATLVGSLQFQGYDGAAYFEGARIGAYVNTTWDDSPAEHSIYLLFYTTNTTGSLTARWAVAPDGALRPWSDSAYNIGTNTIRPAIIYADQFNGAGGNLTSLNASNISSGTLATGRGGTGNDWSAAAQGSVIVINSAGVMSLASGVTDGDVLTYTSGTDTVGWAALPTGLTGSGTPGFLPYYSSASVLADSPLERGTATLVKGDIDFETYGPAAGVGGVDSTTRMYAYGTGITPIYRFLQARGFRGSESATVGADVIGQIQAHGYDGSAYQEAARISFVSEGTWSGSVRTAHMSFYTRDGAGTLTERWRIAPDGDLYCPTAKDIGLTGSRVSVFYVNEINADVGGVGDPSYMFNGFTTTGLYHSSGVGITVAGTGIAIFKATGLEPVSNALDLGTTSLRWDAYLQNALIYGQSYPGAGCYVLTSQTGTLNLNWNNGQVQIVTMGAGSLTVNPDNSSNMFEGGTYSLMVHGPASGSQTLTIGNVDNWVGTSYAGGVSISNGDVMTVTFIKQRNVGDTADLVEAIVRLDNVTAGVP